MKFILENDSYITINKYNKEDFKLTKLGAYIFGYDSHPELRLPRLNVIKKPIRASQISQYNNYLYIPRDQIPKDTMTHAFTKPVESQSITKERWLRMKTKFPYKG